MRKRFKMLMFGIILLAMFMPLVSSLPSPIIQDDSKWVITHTTDNDFTPYLANAKDKKTIIGLVPLDNSCTGRLPKRIYYQNNTEILDDKNKPIDLKCESSKCLVNGILKNCYSISLTEAQAVNINDYIKVGLSSTVYEYINRTLLVYLTDTYDRKPFEIEVYNCDGNKIIYPDMNWTEPVDNTEDNIDFNIQGDLTPTNCIMFKINTFEQEHQCTGNQYYSSCEPYYKLTFENFESKNNITTRNMTTVYPTFWKSFIDNFPFVWRAFGHDNSVQYYLLRYEGEITDLDPALFLIYTSSSQLIGNGTDFWRNYTNADLVGVRFIKNSSNNFNFTSGHFTSLVFYNSTQTYWNVTLKVDLMNASNNSVAGYPTNGNITLQTRTGNNYNLTDSKFTAHWSFDRDNSSTVIEESGQYNCTRVGEFLDASEANGTVGKGYYFDGTNDFINCSNAFSFQNFTWSLWYKSNTEWTKSSADSQFFISKRVTGGDLNGIAFGLCNTGDCTTSYDGYVLFVDTGPGIFIVGNDTITIPAEVWQHYAVTKDDSANTVSLYTNGQLITSGIRATGADNSAYLTIARSSESAGTFPEGAIDEVRIYNRNLSASEIQNLYRMGSHFINWTGGEDNWTNIGIMSDNAPKKINAYSKFMQFQPLFKSNITAVSPYVMNYSVMNIPPEKVPPDVFIVSPQNISYDDTNIDYNLTVTDESGTSSCIMSLDNFQNNNSMTKINETFFYLNHPTLAGSYTAQFYCKDILDNSNKTENVTFKVNVYARPTITYPENNTYDCQVRELNYTYNNNTALDTCWYTLNDGQTNNTITCGNNVTGIIANEGQNNWTVYINETGGSLFKDKVSFILDNPPSMKLLVSRYDFNWIEVNWTITDASESTWVKNLTISEALTGIIIDSFRFVTSPYRFLALNNNTLYTINLTVNDTIGNVNSTYLTQRTMYFNFTNWQNPCPDNEYVYSYYPNGTAKCRADVNYTYPCAGDEFLLGNGSCMEVSTATATTIKQCRYKKFGYYDESLPFIKEARCI